MHEMALAESVLQIVETASLGQGCDKVTRVRLEIGGLSHVEPDALRFCFEAVVKGSIAEGAVLEITPVPGRGWCADCCREVALAHLGAGCPDCGGYGLKITQGTEMRVCEMEVD